MTKTTLTKQMILDAVEADNNTGFCTECGTEHDELEPDARKRKCSNCGAFLVYGAQELLVMDAGVDDPSQETEAAQVPASSAEDMLAREANKHLLKYAAGRTMFCPGCKQVLDWRSTVVVSPMAASCGAEHPAGSPWTLCGTCHDKRAAAFADGLAAAQAKVPKYTLRLDVVDGRKYK